MIFLFYVGLLFSAFDLSIIKALRERVNLKGSFVGCCCGQNDKDPNECASQKQREKKKVREKLWDEGREIVL